MIPISVLPCLLPTLHKSTFHLKNCFTRTFHFIDGFTRNLAVIECIGGWFWETPSFTNWFVRNFFTFVGVDSCHILWNSIGSYLKISLIGFRRTPPLFPMEICFWVNESTFSISFWQSRLSSYSLDLNGNIRLERNIISKHSIV